MTGVQTMSRQMFLEMCCTNNTQPRSGFFRKPLFHHVVLNKPQLALRSRVTRPVFRSLRVDSCRIDEAPLSIRPDNRDSLPRSAPQMRPSHTSISKYKRSGRLRSNFGNSQPPPESLNRSEFAGPKSAACGSPPRRAYRPYRRCGRVAEGGGLLNRYRVVKPYRGFESLRLRKSLKLLRFMVVEPGDRARGGGRKRPFLARLAPDWHRRPADPICPPRGDNDGKVLVGISAARLSRRDREPRRSPRRRRRRSA